MRIILGFTYITVGAYSMQWRGGKGTIICSTLHETSLCVGAWFMVFEACGTSKLCILGIQHIYVWPTCKVVVVVLSHPLKGYQRYRCFPSVGPLGPSLLFAWQQERLIWLRRGLLFLILDDMHDTVWAHTHACVRMNPSHRVEVASTRTPSWIDLALCGELVYDFWHTRQINVVYSNMHARITSIHMHVVVAFEWYTPSRGYRRQAYIFMGPRGHP